MRSGARGTQLTHATRSQPSTHLVQLHTRLQSGAASTDTAWMLCHLLSPSLTLLRHITIIGSLAWASFSSSDPSAAELQSCRRLLQLTTTGLTPACSRCDKMETAVSITHEYFTTVHGAVEVVAPSNRIE